MIPAVSVKSLICGPRFTQLSPAYSTACSERAPFCSAKKVTPFTPSNGSSCSRFSERLASFVCDGLPAHTSPTFKPTRPETRPAQRSTHCAFASMYGTSAGIVSNDVPKMRGRLSRWL